MKSFAHFGWAIPAAALLALPLACGGGGGGDGETTVAASSTQVAQAVLVASASLSGASAAANTSTAAVTTTSVASASVRAAAMGGGMIGDHFNSGMGSGHGMLDLDPTSCDGVDSGTVATHMQWSGLDTTNLCADGLTATLDLNQCAPTADQSMDGQMGMTFTGTTCDPTAIDMDFSGMTITTADGTLTGDFTMGMGDMTFNGDPANLDITKATLTLDGRMQMAGSGFGTVDMDMDHLAFHFDDSAHTGDLNGTLTVHCNGQAFPMTMATDANGLTLDADDNVVAGHMTVTSAGTTHTVTFHGDGSIDVTPTGGEPVHLAEPAASEFCAL